MSRDKAVLAIAVCTAALLALIGWSFYQALQSEAASKAGLNVAPQKAVMAQVEAMNRTRLARLAESGRVAVGMDAALVRLALGEPDRTEAVDDKGETLTIWWYRGEAWRTVTFDAQGRVVRVSPEPPGR